MGMVFQHFNLFPHLTILDNITIAPIKTKKMTKEEILSIMEPKNFIGRAPEQVVEFINEEIDIALAPFKDVIGMKVDLHV